MNNLFSNIEFFFNYFLNSNLYSFLLMLIIFSFIFYFIIIRPQQNRIKLHKKLINSLSKGDEIITSGGLVSKIVKISDNGYVFISINDNNKLIISKESIITILPKGTIKMLF